MRQKFYVDDHPETAESLYSLSVSFTRISDNKTALALEMQQNLYSGDHPDIANSIFGMGVSYSILGDDTSALEYYRIDLEMRQRLFDNDHPGVVEPIRVISSLKERCSNKSCKKRAPKEKNSCNCF
jgi:hypothetical protein